MSLADRFAGLRDALRGLSMRSRLTGVAMLLLLIALFEPHWKTTRDAFDFVVTLDVTQSMNVMDYEIDGKETSRLNYAKHTLRQVLPALPCGSRIGWSIFTEYRVLLLVAPIEVCDNYHELLDTLDRIDGRMAWANASEVAKGVFWSMRSVKELGGSHGVLFITDGHESPPLNPVLRPVLDAKSEKGQGYTYMDQTTWQNKPVYDGKPGDVRGLIVGVGGETLKPIPKLDPEGHPMGYWGADEVMQIDVITAGRTGSAAGEKMVDEGGKAVATMKPTMTEHLSSLKDAYLAGFAREVELGYHRLSDPAGLLRAMTAPEFARPAPYQADVRVLLASIAFILLVIAHVPALLRIPRARSLGRQAGKRFSRT
ncbi:MAG TPA: VWA domain-containing protein [Rhodocyclaceae bacterium]|nr:VWA domain-containing protein [Rhodocyclaceae bacterium]